MKSTQITAIKRVIKSAEQTPRPALYGIFTDESGRACACDGFRIIRTNERPEGLPAADGLPVQRLFTIKQGAALTLPTVKELRAIIKEAKETKKTRPVYDFGDGLPLVNARYLLDMLRVFPDAAAVAGYERPEANAIYFNSKYGDGLLMPVRKTGHA